MYTSRNVSPILKEVLQKPVFHKHKGKKSVSHAHTQNMSKHMTGNDNDGRKEAGGN